MNENNATNDWLMRAAFYELLAKSFLYPAKSLAEAVVSGDYADAAKEICLELEPKAAPEGEGMPEGVFEKESNSLSDLLDGLGIYRGRDPEELLHELRIEHTRLFIGTRRPVVSPYGGVWEARKNGAEPLLFLSNEALAVEQIMRAVGIGSPQGIKEPLDHIGSELEFLQYLCLVLAGVEPAHEKAEISEVGYREFVSKHVRNWNRDFANAVIANSESPFFQAAARLLMRV